MIEIRLEKAELQRFVDEQVQAGHFPSREAVIEGALAQMMAEEVELSTEGAAMIEESRAQIAGGETVEFREFAGRMRRKFGIAE